MWEVQAVLTTNQSLGVTGNRINSEQSHDASVQVMRASDGNADVVLRQSLHWKALQPHCENE